MDKQSLICSQIQFVMVIVIITSEGATCNLVSLFVGA